MNDSASSTFDFDTFTIATFFTALLVDMDSLNIVCSIEFNDGTDEIATDWTITDGGDIDDDAVGRDVDFLIFSVVSAYQKHALHLQYIM